MTSAPSPTAETRVDIPDGTNVCRIAQVVILILATVLHGIFLFKAKPLQSANDRSRWCTVLSLVERGTFQIDEARRKPGWDTIDLVHADGHFYSTKPPMLSAIVAGVTWCVQKITNWKLVDQNQLVAFVVLFLMNLVPFVVSLIVWISILELCTDKPWTRIFAIMIAAFGTLVTPFLMTLNNHTVAESATMIALYAIIKILKSEPNTKTRWPFLLAGISLGWLVANELPAASLAAIACCLAARHSPAKTMKFFIPAALIPIMALITMNTIATGSWKPVYADYGSDKYRFVIDGVPSYWMQPQGVDRNSDSPWVYFIHCTVGHHGILSLSPIFLLSIAGWIMSFRLKDRSLRILIWVGAMTSLVVLGFYMTRIQNYNYGGVSCGLRWMVWLIPFWLLATIPILDAFSRSVYLRAIAVLLGMVSIYSAWNPIENPWRQPWLFQWMESRDWIDYSEERPTLPKPLWSWFASVPETTLDEPAWIEFRVARPGSSNRFVRFTCRPATTGDPGSQVELECRESVGDDSVPVHTRKFLVKVKEFNEGAAPADFLAWSDPDVTPKQQQSDLAFVRGLPRKVAYEAKSIRYLSTPIRKNAFRCTLSAAHVRYAMEKGEAPLNYRCDVWLTDEVPFGVAQVELHVNQPDNNAVMFHERWVIRDSFPKPASGEQKD